MRCTDYGISVPFMPGVMCLNGLADLERIAESASHDFQDVGWQLQTQPVRCRMRRLRTLRSVTSLGMSGLGLQGAGGGQTDAGRDHDDNDGHEYDER